MGLRFRLGIGILVMVGGVVGTRGSVFVVEGLWDCEGLD